MTAFKVCPSVVVVVLMEVDAGTDTLQSTTKNVKWRRLPE
jgi:hypothetical protein